MPFPFLQIRNSDEEKAKKDPSQMRQGYTTGACATAATKAALIALITGEAQAEATIYLPVGRMLLLQ